MNPNHENVKTLPYLLIGFRTGIERALPLTGLISGACHRRATLNPIISMFCSIYLSSFLHTKLDDDQSPRV
jgi:hypothetical protein